jgi:hypothetical protein
MRLQQFSVFQNFHRQTIRDNFVPPAFQESHQALAPMSVRMQGKRW